MTSDAQLKKKRLSKLDPRAYIGYLISYNSTNIYRIWIPYKGIVISTRDVGNAKLQININKSKFYSTKIKYLSLIILTNSITIDPKKV
jgi:hypothetical protein